MKRVYGFALLVASLGLGHVSLAQNDARLITCADDREKECLDRMQGIASRSGDLLTLRLLDGQEKTFRSRPDACQDDDVAHCVTSTIAAYLPALGYVAIRHLYYEGDGGEIVSLRTGESTPLDAEPQFSPDGKRFVILPDTAHFRYDFDFAIWSMQADRPVEEFRNAKEQNNADHWSLENWVSDEELAFTVESFTVESFSPKYLYFRGRLTSNGWHIPQPSPAFNGNGR